MMPAIDGHPHRMLQAEMQHASKVPQITLAFWAIKIAATTLGETGGDAVTMSNDPEARARTASSAATSSSLSSTMRT